MQLPCNPDDRREIALVVIIYNNRSAADYVLPHSTLGCYARMFDYPLIEVNLEQEKKYLEDCAGTDVGAFPSVHQFFCLQFMFQRHCVMARLMEERPQTEWFAFLDADMGVVNPNHLLEEFVNDRADLIFYDRLYNYEIMAGAYLARNTPFARSFLRHWAAYEFRVAAGTLHGTDNGAISVRSLVRFFTPSFQEVFLDHFCAECAPDRRRRCATIWKNSHNFDDLFRYESCAREILGPREWLRSPNGTVRQLAVGRGYWVRDGWQTGSRWSDDDFIKRNGEWRSMFASEWFPAARCSDRRSAHSLWSYRPEFRATNAEIREKLEDIARRTYAGHLNRLLESLNDNSNMLLVLLLCLVIANGVLADEGANSAVRALYDGPPAGIKCHCLDSNCQGNEQPCGRNACYQQFNLQGELLRRGCYWTPHADGWEQRDPILSYYCSTNLCNDKKGPKS
ncbi:hypothetical protein M3Y99_00579700 [Aphelenchoides fujianensis]|nr:hypothetical protein M3Y99_00579700 [Aphelenchoides fujianensis]